MQASFPERLLSAIGAALVVALLGYLLLIGMAVEPGIHLDQPRMLLALQLPRAKRNPHAVSPKTSSAHRSKRLPKAEGKAAPSVAVPVTILSPRPFSVTSPLVKEFGPAISTGTSNQSGPGGGTGGQGNGADGDGDGDVPPRQIKGRLKFSDLPQNLRDPGIESSVSVRYDVDVDGRVRGCIVLASSGSAELDQRTCELIEQRFRFAPSRDRDGHPVRSTIEENHRWDIERVPDPPPEP